MSEETDRIVNEFLDSLIVSRYEESSQKNRDDTAIGVSIDISCTAPERFQYLRDSIDKIALSCDIMGENRNADAEEVKRFIESFIDLIRGVFEIEQEAEG